jgi:hypothetical protein
VPALPALPELPTLPEEPAVEAPELPPVLLSTRPPLAEPATSDESPAAETLPALDEPPAVEVLPLRPEFPEPDTLVWPPAPAFDEKSRELLAHPVHGKSHTTELPRAHRIPRFINFK